MIGCCSTSKDEMAFLLHDSFLSYHPLSFFFSLSLYIVTLSSLQILLEKILEKTYTHSQFVYC